MSLLIRRSIPLIIVLIMILAPILASGISKQEAQKPAPQTSSEKDKPAELKAGPKNIKEKTAVFVFLAWTWLLVGMLVYFIRLKIKEADRVHEIRFYSAPQTGRETEQIPWKPTEKI